MTENNDIHLQPTAAPANRSRMRTVVISAVAAVIVAGAGAGAVAVASNDGPGHWRGKFMRGFMEYRIDQVLTDVGASAEQKDKLKTLVKSTMDDVRPDRGERREMREQLTRLLAAPTIDRAAIEAFRASRVAEMEAKSKTIAKAVADAAEVLTPEQRVKLVEELKDFGPGPGPDHD